MHERHWRRCRAYWNWQNSRSGKREGADNIGLRFRRRRDQDRVTHSRPERCASNLIAVISHFRSSGIHARTHAGLNGSSPQAGRGCWLSQCAVTAGSTWCAGPRATPASSPTSLADSQVGVERRGAPAGHGRQYEGGRSARRSANHGLARHSRLQYASRARSRCTKAHGAHPRAHHPSRLHRGSTITPHHHHVPDLRSG